MSTTTNRVDYIDWLRVGAMFLLLFYHTGRLFDEPAWHIKNAILNNGINIFNRFLDIWHMPLFFLLAGASVWLALEHRTPGAFTKERILRLLVPLVFGMLIIIPPQVYTERIFDGDFSGSFLAWYPYTFQGTYSMGSNAGNLSWHHLWFMAYLFIFSLILLPLFHYFHGERRKPAVSRIIQFLEKPGAIFLPVIPLVIINLTLRPIFGYGNQNLISDWANFCFYITIFFCGFLMVSDAMIVKSIQKNCLKALIAAIIISLGIYVVDSSIFSLPAAVQYMLTQTALAAACWCWLISIIGIGSRLLNYSNIFLKYASGAVLPVYILHQTIIVIMGYFVIQWNISVAVKYSLIVVVTLLSSLVIYETVKRFNVTRFIFGIKLKKQPISYKRTVLERS